MDGMIRAGKLCEFVEGLVKRYNDEQREKVIWEIWLHRVFDKSYPDFVNSIDPEKNAAPTQEEVQSIVAESESILNAFLPACGEVTPAIDAGLNVRYRNAGRGNVR